MAGAQVWNAGKWGLDDEASAGLTGLYAASATATISRETTFARDHVGDEKIMSMFNEQVAYSLAGVTVTAATVATSIATALTTDNKDIWETDYDGGLGSTVYVQSIELSRANDTFETGSISAVGRVGITGSGGPVI